MKLRKISYFLTLCEERSFTRAARRCGVAQPSLTRAIQLLEQDVGGRLFERSNSSVCLTELGILLQPHFEAINCAAETIRRTAAEFSETRTVVEETPVRSYRLTLALEDSF
ncbi:MAG TPA: LysR family transcriptional regulator [Pseudolabrys sp.]|jgi:DNA-binding transcriptional LysR family regulator